MNDFELGLPSVPGPAPEVPGYDVGRLLGCGSTAAVWLARDQVTGREVAVKCFAATGPPGDPTGPAAEDAVRREVRLLSGLDHEHLVKARDVVRLRDQHGGRAGLALLLDYAPGGSLAQLLAARGRLGPGETVTVLTPIAQALAYLHGNGFTHGDVSPGNVLFSAVGKPLLADLGVARMLADPAEPSRPGTAGFRDPGPAEEQRAGLQPGSDVYSVAALGWFCLTGRAPEPERQRPPLPLLVPGVPAGLAEALESGLRSDAGQRPTASELAGAIFRSAPAAPVDLSVSVHPTVLPQLLTRRSFPADARERRSARLRALRTRILRRGQRRTRQSAAPPVGVPRHAASAPGRRGAGVKRALVAFALAVLLAVAGIFAAVLLPGPVTARGPAPASAPAGAEADAQPAAPAGTQRGAVPAQLQDLLAATRPEDAVRGLAALRSYAFSTGNLGLLDQVTVPASPAAAADAEVGARLAESGHVLDGFEARLSLVESSPESTAARAVVLVRVASPPYRERDAAGTVVAEGAAVAEQSLRLVLAPVDGRWRIKEILPGANG